MSTNTRTNWNSQVFVIANGRALLAHLVQLETIHSEPVTLINELMTDLEASY